MADKMKEAKKILKQRLDDFTKAMEEQAEGKSHQIETSMIIGYLSIQTGYHVAMESRGNFKLCKELAQHEYEKLAIQKVEAFLEGRIKDIPPIPKTAKELLQFPIAGMSDV